MVPASEKPGAIRFILQFTHGFAFDHDHLGSPHRRFLIRSPAARGEQRADLRHEFRLHKQIRKGRMGHIGGLRSQGQLGVGGDFQIARPYPHIGHGDAPHFRIILGRHHDLEASCSSRHPAG